MPIASVAMGWLNLSHVNISAQYQLKIETQQAFMVYVHISTSQVLILQSADVIGT